MTYLLALGPNSPSDRRQPSANTEYETDFPSFSFTYWNAALYLITGSAILKWFQAQACIVPEDKTTLSKELPETVNLQWFKTRKMVGYFVRAGPSSRFVVDSSNRTKTTYLVMLYFFSSVYRRDCDRPEIPGKRFFLQVMSFPEKIGIMQHEFSNIFPVLSQWW